MNLLAANRDPVSFDRPEEFLPERWLNGCKGRTDLQQEGGDKLGVTHLTYGAGRRVCPGIDSRFHPSSSNHENTTDFSISGKPWTLLDPRAAPALLHLGASAPRGRAKEARLSPVPCGARVLP